MNSAASTTSAAPSTPSTPARPTPQPRSAYRVFRPITARGADDDV